MWLSTTLVGLLLVHLSVVSCLNYQFGGPRRTSLYGRTNTNSYTPAAPIRVMKIDEDMNFQDIINTHFKRPAKNSQPMASPGTINSKELIEKYGPTVDFGSRPSVVIARQTEPRPPYQPPGEWAQAQNLRPMASPGTMNSKDLLEQYGAIPDFGSRSSDVIARQTYNPTRRYTSPRAGQAQSSYNSPYSSSYTPQATQYTPNRYTPYSYTPEPEPERAFSRVRTFSPYTQSETSPRQLFTPSATYFTPSTPSRVPAPPPRTSFGGMGSFFGTGSPDDFEDQLRSAISPTPNTMPDSSRVPAPPPRTSSGGMGSFFGTGSADDFEDQLRSAISPTPNATPASSIVPAPTPRTSSGSSNGMGSFGGTGLSGDFTDDKLRSASSLPENNPSPSPPKVPYKEKEKVFSKIDGRRLDGKKQTQHWPQLGGYYQIEDAGKYLGPLFKGILLPKRIIEYAQNKFKESQGLSWENKATKIGRKHSFKLGVKDELYDICDVDMLHQAVREAQGDDDDYDNPDPWTYESVYSKEVLDYNRELHNYYRAKHYAGPLEYMDEIHPESHAYAVKMAKHLSETTVNNLDHNYELLDRNMWSENLYAESTSFDGRAPAKLVKAAIDSFYEEKEMYHQYNIPSTNIHYPAVTGHFTCLVWRSSKRMGLGMAKHRNHVTNKTTYVVVVNYDPRGNIQGAFDTNVLQEKVYDDGRPLPKPFLAVKSKFRIDVD